MIDRRGELYEKKLHIPGRKKYIVLSIWVQTEKKTQFVQLREKKTDKKGVFFFKKSFVVGGMFSQDRTLNPLDARRQ